MPVEQGANREAGNAEDFGFAIRSVRVGDGELLSLPGPGTVTVVVGANNVGESTFLAQIYDRLWTNSLSGAKSPAVVTEIGEPWMGTAADLKAWLIENAHVTDSAGIATVTRMGSTQLPLVNVAGTRVNATPGGLSPWFVSNQGPSARVSFCDPASRLEPVDSYPQHPMQALHLDLTKRRKVEEFARRIFDVDLHFDAISASIGFRVAEPGVDVPPANQVDKEYAQAVGRLPQLNRQGDGMRSAIGLVIPLITNEYPLLLVDEPEAFLHPPQARLVGAEIGSLVKENKSQVILSTHDKNILQGLVESGAPVAIVHLTRTDDVAAAQLLDSDKVSELWKDVTLRYGNALDGLFHKAVIVTESDRDSRFYAAAIDSAQEAEMPKPRAHNIMFLGSNGKQNIASIVERLRGLGVRAVSSPDLDILNDAGTLQKLVEAHGGKWEDLAQLYKQATNEFLGPVKPPTVDAVKTKMGAAFDKNTDETLSPPLAAALVEAVAIPKTNWSKLKESGNLAFKADKDAATALLNALDELGIVTVKVGVLENFVTTTNAPKGPEFLPIALEAKAHKTDAAREHAKRLLKAAGITAADLGAVGGEV